MQEDEPFIPSTGRGPQRLAPLQWVARRVFGALLSCVQTKEQKAMSKLEKAVDKIQTKLEKVEIELAAVTKKARVAKEDGNYTMVRRCCLKLTKLRKQHLNLSNKEIALTGRLQEMQDTSDLGDTMEVLRDSSRITRQSVKGVDVARVFAEHQDVQGSLDGIDRIWQEEADVASIHGMHTIDDVSHTMAIYDQLMGPDPIIPSSAAPPVPVPSGDLITLPPPVIQQSKRAMDAM